ncbi:MAG: thymidine phosphorylase, partial [Gemmatimonadaceae bacterium]
MLARTLIERKRNGLRIASGEWNQLMRRYGAGEIPDYQMSALAMAIYFNGLDRQELGALTDAMLHSGATLDLTHLRTPRIDKHSTGGVGDKVSLVLAPLVAACGIAVPMMSGRGLGHTGGTLDKLESIPGFRTKLTLKEAAHLVETVGCAMLGQTPEIAPADRRLYALRDATATVESIPLIAASIMSKKLAEGLTGLVLDVKCGSGAFLPEIERSLELARTMIDLGVDNGCPVIALITAMDRPLGRACGNALEVEESIMALKGEGPSDLMSVTYALGAEMLLMGGVVRDRDEARRKMEVAISSGRAAEKFQQIIEAQGGNPAVVDDPSLLPEAAELEIYAAQRDGVIAQVEPRRIGSGIIEMGGGRTKVEDTVDPSVGFVITARPGDFVRRGEPLATVYARDGAGISAGLNALKAAIRIEDEAEPPLPLIAHRVTEAGVEQYDG